MTKQKRNEIHVAEKEAERKLQRARFLVWIGVTASLLVALYGMLAII